MIEPKAYQVEVKVVGLEVLEGLVQALLDVHAVVGVPQLAGDLMIGHKC